MLPTPRETTTLWPRSRTLPLRERRRRKKSTHERGASQCTLLCLWSAIRASTGGRSTAGPVALSRLAEGILTPTLKMGAILDPHGPREHGLEHLTPSR